MGFEMRRASLELWERLWQSDWNIAAAGTNPWGRDRPKGSPCSNKGGWLLPCGVCGCWA